MVALDVTNPEAVAWFVYRLRKLQAETGIDGFKFDAGASASFELQESQKSPEGNPPPIWYIPHFLLSWGWETEQKMTILVHGGAGEPCFLPQQFRTHKPIASPIEYTHLWVKDVAGQFQGGVCEVRVS